MSFRNHPKEKGGAIGHYQLSEWWFSTFDDCERALIERRFSPLGFEGGGSISQGDYSVIGESAQGFLIALAGWFKKPGDASIRNRIMQKAETSPGGILDQHFFYSIQLDFLELWEGRKPTPEEKSAKLQQKEVIAREQIAIADRAVKAFLAEARRLNLSDPMPYHLGYSELIEIEMKRGDTESARALVRQAKCQGWKGPWDKLEASLSCR